MSREIAAHHDAVVRSRVMPAAVTIQHAAPAMDVAGLIRASVVSVSVGEAFRHVAKCRKCRHTDLGQLCRIGRELVSKIRLRRKRRRPAA